jgi:hypothetical protein
VRRPVSGQTSGHGPSGVAPSGGDETSNVAGLDEEQLLERLRIVGSRKRAEGLRLRAVELARDYRKLAQRQRLDREVIDDDTAAVINAWQRAADAD